MEYHSNRARIYTRIILRNTKLALEHRYVQLIERQQRRVLKDFVGFEKVVASWDTSSSSSNDRVVDEVEADLSVKRVVDVIEKLSLDWSDVRCVVGGFRSNISMMLTPSHSNRYSPRAYTFIRSRDLQSSSQIVH